MSPDQEELEELLRESKTEIAMVIVVTRRALRAAVKLCVLFLGGRAPRIWLGMDSFDKAGVTSFKS